MDAILERYALAPDVDPQTKVQALWTAVPRCAEDVLPGCLVFTYLKAIGVCGPGWTPTLVTPFQWCPGPDPNRTVPVSLRRPTLAFLHGISKATKAWDDPPRAKACFHDALLAHRAWFLQFLLDAAALDLEHTDDRDAWMDVAGIVLAPGWAEVAYDDTIQAVLSKVLLVAADAFPDTVPVNPVFAAEALTPAHASILARSPPALLAACIDQSGHADEWVANLAVAQTPRVRIAFADLYARAGTSTPKAKGSGPWPDLSTVLPDAEAALLSDKHACVEEVLAATVFSAVAAASEVLLAGTVYAPFCLAVPGCVVLMPKTCRASYTVAEMDGDGGGYSGAQRQRRRGSIRPAFRTYQTCPTLTAVAHVLAQRDVDSWGLYAPRVLHAVAMALCDRPARPTIPMSMHAPTCLFE